MPIHDGSRGKNFKAVLFDMDGVLVDSEELISKSARMMFKEKFGVSIPPEAFFPYIGAGEDRYVGGVAEDYGLTLDLPEAKKRTYEFYDMLAGKEIKVFSGAREYVLACKAAGLKVALASAADLVKVLINLRILGIGADFFDSLVTGSDIERKKPFPDIYLLAASNIGVEPRNCLVVEDAVNGIKAGVAAGALCLGLTTSFSDRELLDAGATWCARDLGHAPLPGELG